MKKLTLLLFITCMIVVPGCTTSEAAPAKKAPVYLEFGAAGLGTATFTNMAAYGEVINSKSDYIHVNVQTTSGSVAHYQMFKEGALQLGTGAGTTDYFAWQGGNDIFKEPMRDQRTILVFSRTFQTVMVPVRSNINSMNDLKDKRIAVGALAAPSSIIALRTLSSLGINAKILTSTNAEMLELYKDGRADCYMLTSAPGNANILDAMNTINSKLISLTDEEVQKCVEGDLKGLSVPSKLTNAMYPFIAPGVEINVMTEASCLNVIVGMDDQLVYDLLDLYWSNYDELYANFRGLNCKPEEILTCSTYIHPGAAKFYKERFNIDIPADKVLP